MSNSLEPNASESLADVIDAQAAAWFRRRNFWDWSDADQLEFDSWLAQSANHEIAYWRINGAWTRAERITALRRPVVASTTSRRSYLPFVKPAVAGVAFAVLAGFLGWSFYASDLTGKTFSTPVGGHEILTFGDGTQIELNTNSILRTRFTASSRTAELVRGEAYFKIRHNSKMPFTVNVSGRRIVDIGTEFSVRKENDGIRVSLFEGKAELKQVKRNGAMQTASLLPGDVATATATSISVVRKPRYELSDSSAWRRGLLVFRYTPLRDAVLEVNRYNTQKIVIGDHSLDGMTVYGTVPTQSVDGFVRVAKSALHLNVKRQGSAYVLSR